MNKCLKSKWIKRYLSLAKNEIAEWSKDPSTKVGAVCVSLHTNDIISTGYNGFPEGVEDSQSLLNNREQKYRYVVHAESNALARLRVREESVMFLTHPPCERCLVQMASSMVRYVVFPKIKDHSFRERWKVEDTLDFAKTIKGITLIEFPM